MQPASLHPDLADLEPLLGTWRGAGEGHYPTIEPFTYLEEVEFRHSGKPFLAYTQKTRRADGAPLHSETGYLRAVGEGRVELVVSHSFGVAEVAEGTVKEGIVETRSVALTGTASAKQVDEVRRRITFDEHTLAYDLWMDAVGAGMHHHLRARLERGR